MSENNYNHPPMEKEQLLQVIECIKTICKTATSEKATECSSAENSVQGGMNDVGEFHAACDGPVFDVEKACQFSNDRKLRLSLLKEEFEEYVQAEEENDIVAVADALADMLYIIFGTAHAYNIPLDEIFSEVHSTNMAKVGKNGKVERREDGKILKPKGWKPPQIAKMIEEFNKDKQIDADNLIYEFYRKFVNRDLAKQLDQMFESLKSVEVVEKLKEETPIDELVDSLTSKSTRFWLKKPPSKPVQWSPLMSHPKDFIGEEIRHLTMNGTGSLSSYEERSEPVRFVPPPPEPIRYVPSQDDDPWSWYDDSKEED